jgi:hypothetical protein
MFLHPTNDEQIVTRINVFPNGPIAVLNCSSEQFKAVSGIVTLALEIEIGLSRASLGKIVQRKMLRVDFV